MRRYLEVFFRHPLRFSLPMIIAVVVAVGYESHAALTYASTATLWCDASLPNISTISQGSNYGATTPSADKEAVLEEFLHTQSFDDALARETPLGPALANQPHFNASLEADAIAGSVTLSTPGPQILAISAKAATPALAQGVVQAVVREFTTQLTATLQQRAESLAAFDQAQVSSTSASLSSAQAAVAAYLRGHPVDAATASDPRFNLLESQLTADIQQHSSAESTYSDDQSLALGAINSNAFHVIDSPSVPGPPASRRKKFIEVGIGGLLAGWLITVIALVLVVVTDRSVRTLEDVSGGLGLAMAGAAEVYDLRQPTTRRRWRSRKRKESLA